MLNFRFRVRNWSNGLLLGVGVCTLFGIGFVRLNGVQTTSESHLVRRSAEQSTQSIIHIETGYIIDNSNQEEKRYFEGVKEAKEFVKYQYPSEKFVPLDELVTVRKYHTISSLCTTSFLYNNLKVLKDFSMARRSILKMSSMCYDPN